MNPVEVVQGTSPVVLGLPHSGTWLPDHIAADLNPRGCELADTDWHVDQIYDGLLGQVTCARATFHRYVIDANRDPAGDSLYPGQNTTGLIPLTDFDGVDIWQVPPTDTDITERIDAFHAPYHATLRAELTRVRDLHGVAILYDCHSIRSRIPFLFDGCLPDFNIGTNMGATCAHDIETAVDEICADASGYSAVTNGRFKGGWTTRHYGNPAQGFHAIQMELAQSTYLKAESPPWEPDDAKVIRLRVHLANILQTLADLAPQLRGTT